MCICISIFNVLMLFRYVAMGESIARNDSYGWHIGARANDPNASQYVSVYLYISISISLSQFLSLSLMWQSL